MTREQLLSSWWTRIIVFLWMIVFPFIFILLPGIEMFFGDGEQSWTPVWALIVWMLGPWAASILLKYAGNGQNEQSGTPD
ncbi:MAG: hypothetical protein JJ891_17035 [Rhizobiaceae bacterium]|jgi:hypothetical protein|nr:hypothetical protein [Rhizobiaceae bacterium]